MAGESVKESTYQGQAVLWENKTANPTPLGFLTGHDYSLAYDINNAGQVVGASCAYELGWDTSRAFLWQNGLMQNLGVLDAWPRSGASAINDLGIVVGGVATSASGGSQRATLWYDGVAGYFGELPGDLISVASDINNLGQVVGYSGQTVWGGHACLWQSGAVQDLHTLPGYTNSTAHAINNLGQVIGNCVDNWHQPYNFRNRAFLWENGSMQALPLLDGYQYVAALGINDQGQIVGYAGDGYIETRAVLWNPVPEPSSFLALGSGLAGLGGVFFRRRRR